MKTRPSLLLFALLLLPFGVRAQSVLPNGDFEQGDPAHPGKALHWDAVDGLGVRWTDAPGTPPHGKAIRMDTSVSEIDMVASYQKAGLTQWVFPKPAGNAIAETYGLSLYSDAVPVVPGKTIASRSTTCRRRARPDSSCCAATRT